MFSKEESRQLKTTFWNGFEDHMSNTRSSNGRRINWVSYPTGVKTIFVRLEADGKGARVCFDIQHKSEDLRLLLFEQMTEMKNVMDDIMGVDAVWIENYHYLNEQYISRIVWEDSNLNFYNSEHKLKIYQFLSQRLIKFDLFYQEYKDILISLAN
jgi:hypothetical protein